MKTKADQNPSSYLSINGEKFSLVHNASPLTDYCSKEDCLKRAEQCALKVDLVWDGEKGKFRPLT